MPWLTTGVARIVRLERGDRGVFVEWSDGATTDYPWTWLRDHSHDEATLHPATQQRQLFTGGLDANLTGSVVTIQGDDLIISWDDESPSTLPIGFLAEHRAASGSTSEYLGEPVLWDAESIGEQWPAVRHDEVMDSDAAVADWLNTVVRYGFCMVLDTPLSVGAARTLVERIGYVRETIFGGLWDFEADLDKADTAYTNLGLRPHTDGTYSHDAPGLQLLHCLAFEGTGGSSVLVDGFRIADELRTSRPDLYDVLSRVEVPGHYIGDGAHLVAARPVFRHDRRGQLVQVSFNNADRAPFLLPADEMETFYDALRAFEALANDHRLQVRRRNPPGEAMLMDNWRVLHGRTAYTGHRRLCGAYLNREDFESRLRSTSPPTRTT